VSGKEQSRSGESARGRFEKKVYNRLRCLINALPNLLIRTGMKRKTEDQGKGSALDPAPRKKGRGKVTERYTWWGKKITF